MAGHGKEPVASEADKFPVGLRVLAVDDDPLYLRALETLLRHCKYQPTMVMHARTALEMLREGGDDQFDLVITDVHMPDMDGFELLDLIRLELDLPVILMSADGDTATVNTGIAHGACDYLAKPVRIMELKNIWQHVARKNLGTMNNNSRDNDDVDPRVVQPVIAEGEQGGAKGKKCSKKSKNGGHGSDENKESMSVQKKPRVSWTGELQRRFLKIVNRLGGADKAYPNTILQLMNVDDLTRGSVASHLQNYRINLKRAADERRKSSARRKSSSGMNMNHQGSPSDHHEHQRGPHGMPIQSRNGAMGVVVHGGSTLRNTMPPVPDTTRPHASGSHVNSLAKIPDHTMLNAFSSSHSDKEDADSLREKLLEANWLEASNLEPSSHPAGNSFVIMPNSGMLEHVNQFPVKHSVVDARRNAQFPCHVGTSSNPWQNLVSPNFPGPTDGAPLFTSSQVPSFEASPGKVPTHNIPLAGFGEQMAPFNMESNTTAVQMTSVNFSPITQMVNCGRTNSLLPNLQMVSSVAPPSHQMVNGGSIGFGLPDLQDNSAAPTQILNGGDAYGILHGLVNEEVAQDQPNYNNPFFVDGFFPTMHNQDFTGDVFFGGEY